MTVEGLRRTFTVGLPLVPLTVGQVVDRTAWPAHITLIGNFRASDDAVAEATVRRFAATAPPVRVAVEDEARFGRDRTVLVDLVEAPLLRALHTQLLRELEAEVDGLELLLPDHTRDGYRPHRTVAAGPRPSRGDVLQAGSVSFAELDPAGRSGVAVILGVWLLEGTDQQDRA